MNLYNKMRPKNFGHVKGQTAAVAVLKGLIRTGKLPNALLCIGTRGTGKTTCARIFGRFLNCEHPTENGPCGECENCRSSVDMMELDAASHNGVGDIRELLETTQYAPISKKKVYIIDEVHMLSTAAFNALLKTLEEPPSSCFFILCTTEAHKVPLTIKSRCMQIDFCKISEDVILEQLVDYCNTESVTYEEDALKVIAKCANGALRDAWSILERFLPEERITTEMVMQSLGVTTEEAVLSTLAGIVRGDAVIALDAVKAISSRGRSCELFIKDICRALTDIVYIHTTGSESSLVNTGTYKDGIRSLAEEISIELALSYIDEITTVYNSARVTDMEFAMEASILKMIAKRSTYADYGGRIAKLEEELEAMKHRMQADNRLIREEVAMPDTRQSLPEEKKEPETDSQRPDREATGEPAEHTAYADGFEPISDDELPMDQVPEEERSFYKEEGVDPFAEPSAEPPVESAKGQQSVTEEQALLGGEIGDSISLFGGEDEDAELETEDPFMEKPKADPFSDDLSSMMFGDLFGGLARQD